MLDCCAPFPTGWYAYYSTTPRTSRCWWGSVLRRRRRWIRLRWLSVWWTCPVPCSSTIGSRRIVVACRSCGIASPRSLPTPPSLLSINAVSGPTRCWCSCSLYAATSAHFESLRILLLWMSTGEIRSANWWVSFWSGWISLLLCCSSIWILDISLSSM